MTRRERDALQGILDRYVSLVNCGDCGNWDPEEEAMVKAARAVLDTEQDCDCEGTMAGSHEPSCASRAERDIRGDRPGKPYRP